MKYELQEERKWNRKYTKKREEINPNWDKEIMKKLNKIEKENKPEVENETGSRKEIGSWTNISSKTLKRFP